MNRIFLILAPLFLAGCATDSAVQRQMLAGKEPIVTYTTDKPLAEVADCLESAFEPLVDAVQSMSVTTEGETRIIWVTNLANPHAAVRMTPVDGGTFVDYRARFPSSARAFTNAVTGCR